ncbi:uncharacterized protein N7479_009640 [Penicillium vulpinum]|uniref:uncharacterized protein n=1 Tax=Penicillium vulpinum TaxID=29845 RepID=UPI002547CB1B|nr:uncharacterized protein N7479_009640 [Penicillium vulpinum]KAJ5951227.1 hypothetical protein N7479_009640 [Penicillium vulpinum]
MIPEKLSHGLKQAAPGDAVPKGTVPEGTVPEGTVPEGTIPEDAAFEHTAVENQMSEPMDRREFLIQVSAKHMMFASSVFKKTLTGSWKESELYLKKGSVEVTADGWDSEALLIILRAIHCQYNQIPKKVTLEMLAKISVIADYYDCKDVLYIMTDIWIGSLDEKVTTCSRDLMLWLWVSWFFKRPTRFKEVTSTVMSLADGLIDVRGLPFPDRVIGSMDKSRQEAIENVILLLYETREAFLSGNRGYSVKASSFTEACTSFSGSPYWYKPSFTSSKRGQAYGHEFGQAYDHEFGQAYDHEFGQAYDHEFGQAYDHEFGQAYDHEFGQAYGHELGQAYAHECSDSKFAPLFASLNCSIEGLELEKFSNS